MIMQMLQYHLTRLKELQMKAGILLHLLTRLPPELVKVAQSLVMQLVVVARVVVEEIPRPQHRRRKATIKKLKKLKTVIQTFNLLLIKLHVYLSVLPMPKTIPGDTQDLRIYA